MRRTFPLCAATPVLVALIALACGPTEEPLAQWRGGEVTVPEFEAWSAADGPGARLSRPGAAQRELDARIELELLHAELERRAMADDPDYQRALAAIRARADHERLSLIRRTLVGRVESEINVSESEARALYEREGSRFGERQLHLRVIGAAEIEAVRTARARVEAGESFESVAREVNADPAMRAAGGDLGERSSTAVERTLLQASAGLRRVGDLSDPFRTESGWAVVELAAPRRSTPRPFEEVRERLLARVRRERTREHYDSLVARLRKEAGVEIDAAKLAAFGPPAPKSLPSRVERDAPNAVPAGH